MTAAPVTVSVVIVSRDRPESLLMCLAGVTRLVGAHYEVIVVADPASLALIARRAEWEQVRCLACDSANISLARNIGIAAAAGDVVAFIDDDAVPEPTWLAHLAAPFADSAVAAAGGFVRGRNGISFQWQARQVSGEARMREVALEGEEPQVLSPPRGWAIKTEGTNMALRRDVIAEMGGFDTRFHFFLDETDVNLRLADAGRATALVPLAQVHHAYAASPRRGANRGVTDLTEIGASMAVFLQKHCPDPQARAARWHGFVGEQGARLRDQVRRRWIRPDDVGGLMRGLQAGYDAGLSRSAEQPAPLAGADHAFTPFASRASGETLELAGRVWQARALRRRAAQEAEAGRTVSLFLFSPSALYHRVRFRQPGYWEQKGGLFGRSDRSQPLISLNGFRKRLRREIGRVAAVRGISRGPSQI